MKALLLPLLCFLPSTTRAQSALEQARALQPPMAISQHNGEDEHAAFWEQHEEMLRQAWGEWEAEYAPALPPLIDWLDLEFYDIVEAIRHDPTRESGLLQGLFGDEDAIYYKCRVWSAQGLAALRDYFDAAQLSGIPVRRPNGMHRHGAILSDVPGAVHLPGFHSRIYQPLLQSYLRPVAQWLFQRQVGPDDDIDSYTFVIHYAKDSDTKLASHRDASVYTINLSLNLPHEAYEGSELILEGDQHVPLEPGTATFHLGGVYHHVTPLKSGSRTSLIIWCFGENGYVRVAPYSENEQQTSAERWSEL